MYLLFIVTIICFLMAFTSKLSKWFLAIVFREPADLLGLRASSDKIRRDLAKISMRDNYIEYVQTERKLVQLEKRIAELRDGYNGRKLMYEYGFNYGLYAVLALGLIIISLSYRYTPVVVFGKNFNFEPFGKVLNFPTGVPNAVSTVFWIVVNNFVARTVAGYVK